MKRRHRHDYSPLTPDRLGLRGDWICLDCYLNGRPLAYEHGVGLTKIPAQRVPKSIVRRWQRWFRTPAGRTYLRAFAHRFDVTQEVRL